MNIQVLWDDQLPDTLRLIIADRWTMEDMPLLRDKLWEMYLETGRPAAAIVDALLLPRVPGLIARARQWFFDPSRAHIREMIVCVLPLSSPLITLIRGLVAPFASNKIPVLFAPTLEEARLLIRQHRAAQG
jgi:hypothetical protein